MNKKIKEEIKICLTDIPLAKKGADGNYRISKADAKKFGQLLNKEKEKEVLDTQPPNSRIDPKPNIFDNPDLLPTIQSTIDFHFGDDIDDIGIGISSSDISTVTNSIFSQLGYPLEDIDPYYYRLVFRLVRSGIRKNDGNTRMSKVDAKKNDRPFEKFLN